MQVHQILVSASRYDAQFAAAREIRAIAEEFGPSFIYARYFDEALATEVAPLSSLPAPSDSDDVLIFHSSIGEPEVFEFLASRPERLVLVHHNITPPAFFAEMDPAFAELLRSGHQSLDGLRSRVAMALAVSEFNAGDLRRMGYDDVRVVPVIVDASRLRSVEPDPATAHHLATSVEGTVHLFVGQLLPHKRPDFLIKAHHVLSTYLDSGANLILIGSSRMERYRQDLQMLIDELNLTGAWLTGPVTEAEKAAFFQRADTMVTASEHEGFCVPLVEAMAFDLPVVARAFGAVPETLGGAGLLLDGEDGPTVFAEAMAEVTRNQPLRAAMIDMGKQRLDDLDAEVARGCLRSALQELAS